MADIFAGALRGSHQFAAQAQDDWTSKVAAQLQVATKAPPEQQGVELAKLQEMQHSRANAEKMAEIASQEDEKNEKGNQA
jgi:hypothetical protein